jgi:hypothetical protein
MPVRSTRLAVPWIGVAALSQAALSQFTRAREYQIVPDLATELPAEVRSTRPTAPKRRSEQSGVEIGRALHGIGLSGRSALTLVEVEGEWCEDGGEDAGGGERPADLAGGGGAVAEFSRPTS